MKTLLILFFVLLYGVGNVSGQQFETDCKKPEPQVDSYKELSHLDLLQIMKGEKIVPAIDAEGAWKVLQSSNLDSEDMKILIELGKTTQELYDIVFRRIKNIGNNYPSYYDGKEDGSPALNSALRYLLLTHYKSDEKKFLEVANYYANTRKHIEITHEKLLAHAIFQKHDVGEKIADEILRIYVASYQSEELIKLFELEYYNDKEYRNSVEFLPELYVSSLMQYIKLPELKHWDLIYVMKLVPTHYRQQAFTVITGLGCPKVEYLLSLVGAKYMHRDTVCYNIVSAAYAALQKMNYVSSELDLKFMLQGNALSENIKKELFNSILAMEKTNDGYLYYTNQMLANIQSLSDKDFQLAVLSELSNSTAFYRHVLQNESNYYDLWVKACQGITTTDYDSLRQKNTKRSRWFDDIKDSKKRVKALVEAFRAMRDMQNDSLELFDIRETILKYQ